VKTQDKPGTFLSGALSAESLARVLGTLHGERHTGVLHLSRSTERLTLRFVDGHVVSGAQGPSGRLGDILERCGHLSRPDLDLALEKAALEGRRLGPVLVEEHLVSREAVQEALRLQVRDVLFAALFWGFGAYRFEPDAGPTFDEEISLEISTTALIFEVVSALESPGAVLRSLVDPRTPVEAAPDGLARLRAEHAPLGPADAYVLSRADGTLGVEGLGETAPFARADIERSALALLCCHALLPRPGAGIDPNETVALSREQRGLQPERFIALRKQDLEDTLRSFVGKSHFEVLGVPPTASAEEVKRAYMRLAREYHPDAARHPDLVEATKGVFLRVSEAHNVLGSADSRQRHEQDLGLRNVPIPAPAEATATAGATPAEEAHPLPDGSVALPEAERLLAAGKPFEAVALLEDVLPHLRGLVRNSARLVRAQAYLKTPSGSRPAETELRDLLQEDPSCLEACLMLGRLYRDHGLSRRAAKEFSRALEIAPGHPEAVRELRTLPTGYSGTARLKLAFAGR
jgi:Domain of unknown function (DUF4388)/DnaJ domain